MLPRRRLAALLVTMVIPVPPGASPERAPTSSIMGRVVDAEDGSGLPGVPIRLWREGRPGSEIVATTDIRGLYAIRGLQPAEDYVLRLDYAGFTPVLVGPLAMSAGETARLDVTLRSTALETCVTIGGRRLDQPERELYLEAATRIAEGIRAARAPAIGLVTGALQQIDDLPDVVQEDAREALRGMVEEVLSEIVESGDPFILDLLRDPDPAIQSMAIYILFNQDSGAWLQNPQLRALLQELVESPAEDSGVVTGILMVHVFADRFEDVRPAALALAGGGEVELAREVASVIAWSHEQGKDLAGLRRLFQESGGPLRQEAAIWLAEAFDESLTPDERLPIAWELVRTMEDPSLSPAFRGDAIRAARSLRTEPIIDDALLGLLEPDAWFSGVPDTCRPRHSLAVVLGSLDARPGIAGDLLTLKDRLGLLEKEQRGEVDRMIDGILSKLSLMVD